MNTRSLKCSFGPGNSAVGENANVTIKKNDWDVVLHFDSIDTGIGKARLIGNQAAVDVTVMTTRAGLNFLENTGSGSLLLTTVFKTKIEGEFLAEHSRHISPFGPIPPEASQYYGACRTFD